jgi:hypothetical protein
MAVDEGLVAWVTEALEPVGKVTMRRMMGGACDRGGAAGAEKDAEEAVIAGSVPSTRRSTT